MDKQSVGVSKFLSFVLRHRPDAIGLTLDREGWASITELIQRATASGHKIDENSIQKAVAENDKKRFSISSDGKSIRAVQGHSTAEVAMSYEARVPPPRLFHGTASRFVSAIEREGLRPGGRHHVHLSADQETAMRVGKRHGKPVVLIVRSREMQAAGHNFYLAENGVWLTESVPNNFIDFPDYS